MAKKSTETLVGVFVLLGIIALAFLALKAANLASFSAAKTYTVRARFDNIGGLKKNAPVRSAGVSVGPGDVDHARQEHVPGPGDHEDQRGRAVPGRLVGQDPHRRPAGRPVRGHRARLRRQEPGQRRPDQADAVGRRAGEPDRPADLQQGRRRRLAARPRRPLARRLPLLRPRPRRFRDPRNDIHRPGSRPAASRRRARPGRRRRLRDGAGDGQPTATPPAPRIRTRASTARSSRSTTRSTPTR